jgi:hypothetical protein
MKAIALILLAGLIGLVWMHPGKLKSWGHSTEESVGSSISA